MQWSLYAGNKKPGTSGKWSLVTLYRWSLADYIFNMSSVCIGIFLGVVLLLHCSTALHMFYYSMVFQLFCQYSVVFHQCSGVLPVFQCSVFHSSGVPGFIVCCNHSRPSRDIKLSEPFGKSSLSCICFPSNLTALYLIIHAICCNQHCTVNGVVL